MGLNNPGKRKRKVNWDTYQEVKKQRNILAILIPIFILLAGFFAYAIWKPAHIRITNSNIGDQFDSIELLYIEDGQMRTLGITGNTIEIDKNAELLGLRVYNNETDNFNETIISNSVEQNFTFEDQQNQTNIEYLDGINSNITYIDTNVSTDHYKGVDSFFFDTTGIAPDNWTGTGGIRKVQDSMNYHDKVLELQKRTTNAIVSRNFTSQTNGTIEYWFLETQCTRCPLTTPYVCSCTIILLNRQTKNYFTNDTGDNIFQVGYKNGKFGYYTGDNSFSTTNQTTIANNIWYNIKIEFRGDGAPNYANLKENGFNLYVNDIQKIWNGSFIRNSSHITFINYRAQAGRSVLDAISWNWGKLELDQSIDYEPGMKDQTWNGIVKFTEWDFSFNRNYKHIKNFNFTLTFTTNRTLNAYDYSDYAFYWFNIFDTYIPLLSPITTNFSYIELDMDLIAPSINFMNDTLTNETNVRLRLFTTNLGHDYDFNTTAGIKASFWKEISEFSYINTTSLNFDSEIEVESSFERTENQMIFTTIVNITEVISFGSWILTEQTIINHTLVITELFITFGLNQFNFLQTSFFGLLDVEIEVVYFNLENEYLDIEINQLGINIL